MTEQTIEKPVEQVEEVLAERKAPEQLAKEIEELIFKDGTSECSAIEILSVLQIVQFKVMGSMKQKG